MLEWEHFQTNSFTQALEHHLLVRLIHSLVALEIFMLDRGNHASFT